MLKQERVINVKIKRDELNRSLGGGVPTNSTVLIEGTDGAGKSLLSQRFLYGMLQNDYSVSYISTELDTKGFIEQMASLQYDVKYNMLDERLLFISLFPFYGKGRLRENFLDILLRSKKIFSNEVIIFDTLSFLLIDDAITQEDAFAFLQFLKRLNALGKTIILCVDPEHVNTMLLTLIRNSCDAILNLEIKSFAGQMLRVIGIRRYKRSEKDVMTAIPFRVEPGRGLVIEIASLS